MAVPATRDGKLTAGEIRTGHVIVSQRGSSQLALEVAVVRREWFHQPGDPEGFRVPVVRFDGWVVDRAHWWHPSTPCTWIEAGWGQLVDGELEVIGDRRGELSFQVLGWD